MARLALITTAVLPWIAACGSTSGTDDRFAQPNSLMDSEITDRISQIEYQHREELFNNLLWLVQTGEQAIPALLQGTKHADPKTRSNCAWALGQIGDRRVIPDLQRVTNDNDETVRLEVARSLVHLGDIKHCPPLIDALDSDKAQVRYLCHEALKAATARDFGYDHLTDNMVQRRQAILAWRRWWSELSGDPWFVKTYAAKHGLVDQPTPAQPLDPAATAPIVTPPAAPEVETAPRPAVPDDEIIVTPEPSVEPQPAPSGPPQPPKQTGQQTGQPQSPLPPSTPKTQRQP